MSRTYQPDEDPGPPPPPKPAERYVLGERIGLGATGEVFVAFDKNLGREVAIKLFRLKGPGARDRFVAEAQVTAQLQHPQVVPVFELGEMEDGTPFLAMKRVEGESLLAWLGRRPSLEQRIEVMQRTCDAMAYAHDRKILHRDLKPENVMVGAYGQVLVMDWGLARPMGQARGAGLHVDRFARSSQRTMEGMIAGTPAYMSPEQAEGRVGELDQRSDVYGLGAVLYELLVGAPPFDGEPMAVLEQVKAGKFKRPRQRRPEIPRELEAVVLKAMARRPQQRYGSATAMREDLDAFLARRPLVHLRSTWGERLGKWAFRHRAAVGAGVAVALAAAFLLLGGLWRYAVDVGRAKDQAISEAERAKIELGHARLALADALVAQSRYGAAREALAEAATSLTTGPDATSVMLARSFLAQDSPEALSVCKPHGEAMILAVALAADGTQVGSLGRDGRMVLSDPLDCRVLAERAVGTGLAALAFVEGRLWAAQADGHKLSVFSIGGEESSVGLEVEPMLIHLGPEGGWLVGREGQTVPFSLQATPGQPLEPRADGGMGWPDGDLRVGTSLRTGGELGGAWSATGSPRWTEPGVAWVDADAAGQHLLVGTAAGVSWRSLSDGALRWERSLEPISRVGIAPGERYAWASRYNGTVLLLSLDDGRTVAELAARPGTILSAVSASADARLLTASSDAELWTWLIPRSPPRHLGPQLSASAHALALSPDGRLVAVGDEAGGVILVDLATGVELGRWQVGEGLRGLAFSPDGLSLAALPKAPELHLLDLLGEERRVVALPARGMSALWPGELWVACRNGVMQRIPVDGSPLPPPTPLFDAGVWHMSLLPDGRFLVGAHGGGPVPIILWDPTTKKGEEIFERGPSHYRSSASQDGRLAAVGMQSGEVPIWELGTGKLRRRLKADDGPTLAAAFTPDGTQLATTGFGGRVQLWDVESGALLRSVDQHGGPGTALLITPDGDQLLSVGADHRVGRLWLRERAAEARGWLAARPGEALARLGWWERVGPEAGPLLTAQARLALGLPVEEGASPYLKLLGRRR